MATTKRASTLGKEKRCTSLSNSPITHAQRRPFQPSIEKQVPNYLKPTVTSRNDAIRNSKKTGPENPSHRPNLLRRRSFDGPPSAAPSQKALFSPGRDESMSRSASSCSKTTTTAAKSTLERVSRKPNAGKPENLSSSPRSLKKASSPTTKKGRTLVSKKRPCSHEKKEAQNLETKHGKEEIVDHQVEEVMKNNKGEMDDFQMPKSEESEHLDVEDGKDALADISTVWHQHNVPDQTEEMKDNFHEEKSDHTQHDEDKENHRKDQETNVDHDFQEEIPHEDAKTETEDGGEGEGEKEDCATDQVTATKEIVEEKQLESSQEEGEGSQQGLESSKEKIVEGEDEKSEPEAANVVAKSQVQAGHGKKETPTPYNEVFEETASRLREERKNKVRALVGAFETVIDKESSNAK